MCSLNGARKDSADCQQSVGGGDAMGPNPCTVGEHLQMTLDCHKTSICPQTGLRSLGALCETDALLLQLRTGLMGLVEGDTVCMHHEKLFVERYEHTQRVCCNPFSCHKKAVRKGLRPIDLDEASFLTDRFALQFVPGWKLCTRCAQLLNGHADLEVDLRQRRKRDREGRTAKALKSLEFANPGRQTDFASDSNRRDKRRVAKLSSSDRQTMGGGKSKVYDSRGLLMASGRDMCDCLDVDCMGCFYPCPDCTSRKCGVECRCDRKWLYEQVEVEGGEIIRNKYAS
ncbi:ARL14 effector protein isoform X1 [Conger conger]|uniref:ARL14 effector protein isoform X1 n=1 Tax=Conger conger TaxID=82655 RepID=UPI002A5A8FA6|nr:ARL14 effector protein isoform X1 [Conger conger]XP_061100241.1 ARL14 effector protein isoform X1 [Conger conger]